MVGNTPTPRLQGRTIRNHLVAWAAVAIVPYLVVLLTAAFGHTDRPFGQWFGLSVFFLVDAVLVVAILGAIELTLLHIFSRSHMGTRARTVIPGVVIFLLALLVPNPTITALFPPQPGNIVPLLVIVGVAAALGVGVTVSHRRYAQWSTRGMGPAGQD